MEVKYIVKQKFHKFQEEIFKNITNHCSLVPMEYWSLYLVIIISLQ